MAAVDPHFDNVVLLLRGDENFAFDASKYHSRWIFSPNDYFNMEEIELSGPFPGLYSAPLFTRLYYGDHLLGLGDSGEVFTFEYWVDAPAYNGLATGFFNTGGVTPDGYGVTGATGFALAARGGERDGLPVAAVRDIDYYSYAQSIYTFPEWYPDEGYEGGGYWQEGVSRTPGWRHVAWVRDTSSLRLYIDGVCIEPFVESPYAPSGVYTHFGVSIESEPHSSGYRNRLRFCQLRLTRGVARYTGDFTPPDEPFYGLDDAGGEAFWTRRIGTLERIGASWSPPPYPAGWGEYEGGGA